jgi:hypothetical protein
MKHLLTVAALFAATTIAVSSASAQAPSDSNRDKTGISEINGHPIKVGEHNEYYYEYKRWNVSTNPLGLIYGVYGLSISYGISDNVALRGDVNYVSLVGDDDDTGYEVGVGAPIYLRRTYQGPFIEPGIISRGMSGNDYTEFGPQVLVGWHWTWDSGLNMAVAAGVGRNWASDGNNHGDELFANGYFRVGYAFE